MTERPGTDPAASRTKPRRPSWVRELHLSDLQGLAQLTTQATLGVAGLAETVQGNVYKAVATAFGPLGARWVDRAEGATGVRRSGITGLVYGSVRGVTRLAGGTANAVLGGLAPAQRDRASSPQREAMLSALNGVLGDRLVETANPLAITMRWRTARADGAALTLNKAALAEQLPQATGKLLVLMHGLCMNDLQWAPPSTDGAAGMPGHAPALAEALGCTPIYLHYNTGLPVVANGRQLCELLDQLAQAWPVPVEEITVLAHSMGGLVARSAVAVADAGPVPTWRQHLKTMVFLGTPHHGAPLERLGSWVDALLDGNPLTRPFARLAQLRSQGITDLRHGRVSDGGEDSAAPLVPLPDGVACFAVAASTTAQPGELTGQLWGDGLVPVPSALGQHSNPARSLTFASERQWLASGMGHMALLHHPDVTAQLLRWLRPRRAGL
ncbi:alpha/beta hydrolase [Polaromonas sp. YR568]|uniref:lipase family alpha/beta hydrolase n=1 Tax=Polaromonas sp. YR568 TaxID=1855301 RepID=UPI003137E1AC